MYGEGAVTNWTCQKLFVKFHVRDFSLDDVPWWGWPVKVDSDQIGTWIQYSTTQETADILKISKSIKLLVKMKNVSFLWGKKMGLFGHSNMIVILSLDSFLGLFIRHGEHWCLFSCHFTKEVPGLHRRNAGTAPGAAEGGSRSGGGRGHELEIFLCVCSTLSFLVFPFELYINQRVCLSQVVILLVILAVVTREHSLSWIPSLY